MTRPATNNVWLHRFALLTALATLCLIAIGGLVTSKEAGMSVPDWPTSYGYNMFALPLKFWTGGVFYEHTHRLWATVVGTLVVALTRWLGGAPSRKILAIVGLGEMLAGFGIFWLWPNLKPTGHFLTGIGGVVLLAAIVWAKNAPAHRTVVKLGWLAFGLVQFQGLLGGLRVVLFKDQIGIFHGALAQIFFVTLCVIALMTSRWWMENKDIQLPTASGSNDSLNAGSSHWLARLVAFATILIFLQLILGATMRHQHAGLAISDFPLAHGRLWPATDSASILRYNQERVETVNVNPITAFQVQLQMVHRVMAALILLAVAACAWLARAGTPQAGAPMRKLTLTWLGLILAQVALGAATVLLNKAADIATAHVMIGALSLAAGSILTIICFANSEAARTSEAPAQNKIPFAPQTNPAR